MNEELKNLFNEKGNLLEEREQKMLKLRFGLNDEQKAYTLKEIGSQIGLSGQRVSQIIKKIINKLNKFNEERV